MTFTWHLIDRLTDIFHWPDIDLIMIIINIDVSYVHKQHDSDNNEYIRHTRFELISGDVTLYTF